MNDLGIGSTNLFSNGTTLASSRQILGRDPMPRHLRCYRESGRDFQHDFAAGVRSPSQHLMGDACSFQRQDCAHISD